VISTACEGTCII